MDEHPLLRWFRSDHLSADLAIIPDAFRDLASDLLDHLPKPSAERSAGIRKLIEAKDCFVRAAVEARDD